MTEQTTTSTADDKAAPAANGDTSAKAPAQAEAHMIPKSRLDEEIAKRRSAEEALSKMADELAGDVPEKFRALVPVGLGAAERIAWIRSAKATGILNVKAEVAETDTGRPTTSAPQKNLDAMPALAKIAAGYRK
ncbi:MAG: hypothetical protein U1E62_01490 [Alsobacter sp.]